MTRHREKGTKEHTPARFKTLLKGTVTADFLDPFLAWMNRSWLENKSLNYSLKKNISSDFVQSLLHAFQTKASQRFIKSSRRIYKFVQRFSEILSYTVNPARRTPSVGVIILEKHQKIGDFLPSCQVFHSLKTSVSPRYTDKCVGLSQTLENCLEICKSIPKTKDYPAPYRIVFGVKRVKILQWLQKSKEHSKSFKIRGVSYSRVQACPRKSGATVPF